MNRQIAGFLFMAFALNQLDAQVKDIDNNAYSMISIGGQTWMSSNLKTSKFRNGDPILYVTNMYDWQKACLDGTPAFCYYGFNSKNGTKYGKIYNWFAVIDSRGLAPDGFRVPSRNDINEIFKILGDPSVVGHLLKSTSGWNPYTWDYSWYDGFSVRCIME